jgi:hypothetical protein
MFGKKHEAEGPKKCAHPACFCIVEPGKKFCSDRCHDSHGMTELNCQCHHPACESAGA